MMMTFNPVATNTIQTQFSAKKRPPAPNDFVRRVHQNLMDDFQKRPEGRINTGIMMHYFDNKAAKDYKLPTQGWGIIINAGKKMEASIKERLQLLSSEKTAKHLKSGVNKRFKDWRKSKYDQHWDLYQYRGLNLLIKWAKS